MVGQALAAVLGTVALILSAVALVCHAALMAAGAPGASWVDIGLDVVGLATFGIGRAAVGGVRAGAAAVRGSAGAVAATQRVAAAVARRGGTLNARAAAALQRGDIAGAAAASGMRASVLKGMFGNALGSVPPALRGGGLKATRNAIAGAPRHVFPGAGTLARAMSPTAVGRETVDALKTIFTGSSWTAARTRTVRAISDAMTTLRVSRSPTESLNALTRSLGHPLGEQAAREVRAALPSAQFTRALADRVRVGDALVYETLLNRQIGLFWASTAVGSGAGWGDLRGAFDRFKQ